MHILFVILIAFFSLIVALLLAGLFISKGYAIECQIAIDRPKKEVFNYISITKNQQFYNKWWMDDPDAKKTYAGIDGTLGFIAAWDSNNNQVGKGEQEIMKIKDGAIIDYQLRFKKPFENIANSYLTTKKLTDNETLVTWGFNGTNKYPMNLMFAMLKLEKVLAGDLQSSLENLKNNLENRYEPKDN